MGRRIVWTTLDSELLSQVKDLETKFDVDFEGLLVMLLRSYLDFELLKSGEEVSKEEGEEL